MSSVESLEAASVRHDYVGLIRGEIMGQCQHGACRLDGGVVFDQTARKIKEHLCFSH